MRKKNIEITICEFLFFKFFLGLVILYCIYLINFQNMIIDCLDGQRENNNKLEQQ